MNRRSFLLACAAPLAAQSQNRAPRFRSALCAYSFREALKAGSMTYHDLVKLAVETGIDGLDLTVYWFPSKADDFLLPLRRQAYRSGVEIYSISVRSEMTRATPELRDKEVVELREWIDAAQKLGATHIRVFGGRVPQGRAEDEAAGWVVETLKRAGEYAAKQGIILGLENHGGITERAERILDIVRRVDSPWVAVNLDTGNFRQNVLPQIESLLPYAANVQLKAQMRDEAGVSRPSDWDRLFRLFARYGYQGYVALEYEAKEDPKTAVPRLLRQLHKLTRQYST
jgi:sugar phosphate isomerase/epimerase